MAKPQIKQDSQTVRQSLGSLRAGIDRIDDRLAALLAERLTLVRAVGSIKAGANLPVLDSAREAAVLDRIAGATGDTSLEGHLRRIYQCILAESKQLQSRLGTESRRRSPLYFRQVLVVGVGLIGGALARQIRRCHPGTVIAGSDQPAVLEQALSEGIIDAAAADLPAACSKATLVILSAGPEANLSLLNELAPHLRRGQIVLDVGSTKSRICELAGALPLAADFIGGHPFFGSEKAGLSHSDELVVSGQTFVLCPGRCSELSLVRLTRWLQDLQLCVRVVDAETHDRVAAATSHIIQLAAVAIGSALAEDCPEESLAERLRLSGPGLQQLARLMESPPGLWQQIVVTNKPHVLTALKALRLRLACLEQAIESGDRQVLSAEFNQAARVASALGRPSNPGPIKPAHTDKRQEDD